MASIFFVRHGQASFFKDNYDQLSPKGVQQAQALSQYFSAHSLSLSQGITGTLQRQIDTFNLLSESQSEIPHIVNKHFDEHHGPQVVRKLWPEDVPQSPTPQERKVFMKKYFQFFEDTLREWVLGRIPEEQLHGIEPWPIFKEKVVQGISEVLDLCQKGENVVVVSSGGPVAVAVGYALNLTDVKTMELSWNIANSSITEFLYSKGRFSLKSFNTTPHLVGSDLLSLV